MIVLFPETLWYALRCFVLGVKRFGDCVSTFLIKIWLFPLYTVLYQHRADEAEATKEHSSVA